MIAPNSAHASTNQVVVDNVTFVTESGAVVEGFEDGSRQLIRIDMSVPDNASVPVAGTIYFDDRLNAVDDRITIRSPEGDAIGQCDVYADRAVCSLQDSYVLEHPARLSGSITVAVFIGVGNSEDEDLQFDVGGEQTNTVTVFPKPFIPGPEQCQADCNFGGTNGYKYGNYSIHENTIEWAVRLIAGPDGMPVGVPVVIQEHWDDELYESISKPRIMYFDKVERMSDGRESLQWSEPLPDDMYEVSDDGKTVSFITTAGLGPDADLPDNKRGLNGRVYDVYWKVKVLDGGASPHYDNSLTVTVGNPEESGGSPGDNTVYEKDASVNGPSSSGYAVGYNEGRISLEKLVTGTAADRDDLPPAYTVNYTACNTNAADYNPSAHTSDSCSEGSVQLRPETSAWLPAFPAGTRVVGTEVQPTEPENVTWDGSFQLVDENGDPVSGAQPGSVFDVTFSTDNGNLGGFTYFQVTNEATDDTPDFVPFTARKEVTNDDNMDLSSITGYTLNYTYPAGRGFDAGSGTITMPADGSLVTSQQPVPVGAILTFTEELPAVPNGNWRPVVVTENPLTITEDGNQATVVVQNEIDLQYGMFSAVKTIQTDDDIDPRDLPEIRLNYSYTLDGELVEKYLMLQPGAPATLSDEIPVGTLVTFEEVTPSNYPGLTWGTPIINPSEITLTNDPDQDVSVEVINPVELNHGHFTARKTVTVDGGLGIDSQELPDFSVTYTWTLGNESGEGVLTIRDGESEISNEIPIGANVQIGELAPGSAPVGYEWETPEFEPGSFFMQEDVDVAVQVTNPLVATHGVFTATKQVTDEQNTGGDFSGLPSFTLNYSWSLGNTQDSGRLEVTNGHSVTSDLIPFGADVEVTEVTPTFTPPGYTWGNPVITPSTFTMAEGATTEVVVQNPAVIGYGDFTAHKVIENLGNLDISANSEFVLAYQWNAVGNIAGGLEFLYLKANGSTATSKPIPYGATVSVHEVPPTAPEGSDWLDPSLIANGTEITQFVMTPGDDQRIDIEVKNTLQRENSRFRANKALVNTADADLTGITGFVLEYDYVFPWVDESAPAAERGGTETLMLPISGRVVQSIILPHGTEVTVSEVTPVGVPGAAWLPPEYSYETFLIDATLEVPLTVEVINTLVPEVTEPVPPVNPEVPNDPGAPGKPEPSKPGLADTGADNTSMIAAVAFLLLLAAGVTLAVRRHHLS